MMRVLLFSLAAAASALAVASPASAQYYPQPPQQAPYGYGAPGYGAPAYGAPAYGHGFAHLRNLRMRVDGIQRQIRFLDRRNILSNREARRLRDQSEAVERRLHRAARYGLNPYEARDIEVRIAQLEYRVHRDAIDRNGRRGGYYGQRDDRRDRDDDRWDRDDDRWDRDDD